MPRNRARDESDERIGRVPALRLEALASLLLLRTRSFLLFAMRSKQTFRCCFGLFFIHSECPPLARPSPIEVDIGVDRPS